MKLPTIWAIIVLCELKHFREVCGKPKVPKCILDEWDCEYIRDEVRHVMYRYES